MPVSRVLLLGDICSRPGRQGVIDCLPQLRTELGLDFVIANAENAAGGYGLTPEIVAELLAAGVDCITTGDHFLDRRQIVPVMESEPRLLRPLNFPDGVPGRGIGIYDLSSGKIAVVNLLGRVYMRPSDCPFQRVRAELANIRRVARVIIVDFHAEATAEKLSMGWYLDGEVTAVLGTHTHVATADERVLPRGTAYMTDVGMCGAQDSVLGMRQDQAIRRMVLNIPLRLEAATGRVLLSGALVELDRETGSALCIQRLTRVWMPSADTNRNQVEMPSVQ